MILVGEVLRSLPDAEDWYRTRGLGCRLRIDVNIVREPPTLSRYSPASIKQFRTIEFQVVKLIRGGDYVYDWEMLV